MTADGPGAETGFIPDGSFERVREVFEQWELYDAIIRHDYMLHKPLARAIADYCRERYTPGPVLDLGCGDGWLARQSLQALPVDEYVGIDLSQTALHRADRVLSGWASRRTLRIGNLADVLIELPDAAFHLAMASYSLHHFREHDKRALLRQIRRVLRDIGIFIWVDVVRQPGESREAGLKRFEDRMAHEWTELTLEQRSRAIDHVLASDFPEPALWMHDACADAGLALDQVLLEDPCFAAYAYRSASRPLPAG